MGDNEKSTRVMDAMLNMEKSLCLTYKRRMMGNNSDKKCLD